MRNCLHWAASCGHLKAVEELCFWLRPFLNDIINMRDYLGDTPIHLAARFGHVKIVKYLLRSVDWDILNDSHQHSPFFSAVAGGHITIMEVLHAYSSVDKLEHVTISEDTSGHKRGWSYRLTPLAEASRQGFTAVVRHLLKCNQEMPGTVNLNSINEIGENMLPQTPLDLAVDHHHTDCIAILKLHGAKTLMNLTTASDDEDEDCSEENEG
jgi:ankyrin repeat protein